MPDIFVNFLRRFDGHTQELLGGASVAFVLKVFAAGFVFLLNVVLARLLGAEGSGIFFLAYTIVVIVASIGRIGMENVLVRFVASSMAQNSPGKVQGVYNKALVYSMLVSMVLSILFYHLSPWISINIFAKKELTAPLKYMSLAIMPLAMLTLHGHALRGLKKIAASISTLSIFVPLITGIAAITLVPKFGIDAAAIAYVVATIITLIMGRWFWVKSASSRDSEYAPFDTRELFSSARPLFVVVMMNLIISWAPLIFLGVWESSQNVGIYSAASRTAALTSFVLVAVNSIAAPKFAELYQLGDIRALGRLARNSCRIMVVMAAPALILFLLAPEQVLTIFGDEFSKGAVVLMIIAVGQFVNVATGSVGYLLMMSANERLMRNNLVFCTLIGIALNLILIPEYGIIGGAISAAITLVLQNTIAMVLVWKKLNIMTLPWPLI